MSGEKEMMIKRRLIWMLFVILMLSLCGCDIKENISEAGLEESSIESSMTVNVETENVSSEEEVTCESSEKEEESIEPESNTEEAENEEAGAGQKPEDVYGNKVCQVEPVKPTGPSVESTCNVDTLPEMNNKLYAKWENNIYYRRYNAASMKEGELWADFGYSEEPLVEKDLMCMDVNGNITCVGKDYGFGSMYIAKMQGKGPRIISTRITNEGDWQIYSCDLTGGNIEPLYDGEKYLSIHGMHNGRIFFKNDYVLYVMDTATGSVSEVPDSGWGEWIAYDDSVAYFRTADSSTTEIRAYYFDSKESKVLAQVYWLELLSDGDKSWYQDSTPWGGPSVVEDAELIGNELYFQLVSYAGTSHVPQYGAIFKLDLDTNTCMKIAYTEGGEPFNVVIDGENTWVYYNDYVKNEVTGAYESAVCAIQLEGNKEAPTAVFPYCNKHEVTYLRYNDGNYGLRVTPDDSGFTYIVMSKEEIDALGIGNPEDFDKTGGEMEWNIVRSEYVDDKLFFSVEISDHDSENDIGWRYYYTRRITYDYYKDLSTGEVVLLQSY